MSKVWWHLNTLSNIVTALHCFRTVTAQLSGLSDYIVLLSPPRAIRFRSVGSSLPFALFLTSLILTFSGSFRAVKSLCFVFAKVVKSVFSKYNLKNLITELVASLCLLLICYESFSAYLICDSG